MKDIYDIVAESRKKRGQLLALATIVHVEGSSYRRPGARMLICDDGQTVGSLSGGCIEEEIAARAFDVLRTGVSITMPFDTRKRFGCHGKIDIFIERVREEFLVDLARELAARRKCFVVTTPAGSFVRVSSSVTEAGHRSRGTGSFPDNGLVQEIHPPLRLFIIGHGPDSTPLRKLCELVGWDPIEVAEAEALDIEPDDWTAAIVKSHNFGRDFVALAKLLPLNLRYVGLIGPKKRRDQLLNNLLEIGVAMNAGFFAPAGLDLDAETPEEIALAIVSEIQRVFTEASGQSLRDRKLPIHGVHERNDVTITSEWHRSER